MRYAVWARGVTDCVSRVGGEEKGREYTTGAAPVRAKWDAKYGTAQRTAREASADQYGIDS